MVLEAIVEPILIRLETNEYSGCPAMSCNHDFFFGGKTEILRQIILNLRQSHRPGRLRLRAQASSVLRLSG